MDEPEMTKGVARLWAVAQALARTAHAVRGDVVPRLPPLLFFTDPDRTPRPWEIAATLPPGSGVVYRHFGAPDALTQALRLRAVTRDRGVRLLVGLDADLADRIGADGLHLPERALSAGYALSGRRPDWILTGAVHSVEAALGARDLDGVVLSPIFPAGGRSAERRPLGIAALTRASAGRTPVIALGGIDAETADGLVGTGASGLAAVNGLARPGSA
ncbi:MAG: thiamine phosphate synthase [Caulobacteraceae bacterium]|nr:thiamine phosphate synthase [Caulobacteraceae bacterium]